MADIWQNWQQTFEQTTIHRRSKSNRLWMNDDNNLMSVGDSEAKRRQHMLILHRALNDKKLRELECDWAQKKMHLMVVEMRM